MNSFSLVGKYFLVTGASSGIGRQVAISISEQGGNLIITGRNEIRLKETINQLTAGDHSFQIADLINEEDIVKLVDSINKIDGVAFCAGVTSHLPAQFIKQESIESISKINFESPLKIISQIIKKKKINKSASLVFISSIATKYPYFGGSLYISSKSALEGLSKTLALELASKGIRSNCLSPAYVRTPMVDATEGIISKEAIEESLNKHKDVLLLGIGEPEDVANTVVFFLSDASKWITGQNLVMGAI